jgi:hypothetical protein
LIWGMVLRRASLKEARMHKWSRYYAHHFVIGSWYAPSNHHNSVTHRL